MKSALSIRLQHHVSVRRAVFSSPVCPPFKIPIVRECGVTSRVYVSPWVIVTSSFPFFVFVCVFVKVIRNRPFYIQDFHPVGLVYLYFMTPVRVAAYTYLIFTLERHDARTAAEIVCIAVEITVIGGSFNSLSAFFAQTFNFHNRIFLSHFFATFRYIAYLCH